MNNKTAGLSIARVVLVIALICVCIPVTVFIMLNIAEPNKAEIEKIENVEFPRNTPAANMKIESTQMSPYTERDPYRCDLSAADNLGYILGVYVGNHGDLQNWATVYVKYFESIDKVNSRLITLEKTVYIYPNSNVYVEFDLVGFEYPENSTEGYSVWVEIPKY